MNRIAAIIMLILLFLAAPFAKNYAKGQELIQRGNTLIIRNDRGGPMANYLLRYSQMRAQQNSIAIDGECDSSCTLFLGFIPPRNTCITANAKLGFHRASRPEGTTIFLMNYPMPIILWILSEGITEDIKYLPDEIMKALFPRCPSELINPPDTEKID